MKNKSNVSSNDKSSAGASGKNKNWFRHLATVLALCPALGADARYSFAAKHSFKKILVVVLENADYDFALKQSSLAVFAEKVGLLTDFRAEGHPFPRNLLLIVTFDESGSSPDNRIYTVLFGSGVKAGSRSDARYDHYSLLRLIENQFDLGTLGVHDVQARPIAEVWN